MAVHVSIHDVSPVWADELEGALALCRDAGAVPALLVVPDFHRRAPLAEHPTFCERLRGLQAEGHEVYLHGWVHQGDGHGHARDRRAAAGRLGSFVSQRVLSAGEAEMAAVGPEEGRRRIDAGERALEAAGLRVQGFVPPAWAMPRWLRPMLAARGYAFTEDHLRVYDPAAGLARASVVLNWASRSAPRLLSTVGWCRAARHARAAFPTRIAIHPADMRFLLLRREIARTLEWARGDFVARGRDLLS
ncbi:MAG TPA: DUF2334 domain-containing protein [Polyangiaceae bacterium]|nr:DUF2334 domain-containing protein [Polyangiaceae bacterium]